MEVDANSRIATYLLTYLAAMSMLVMRTSVPFVQSDLIQFYSITIATFGNNRLI